MATLTPQSGAGSLGSNSNNPGVGGGMEELLPLVIQLTKPEQVRLLHYLYCKSVIHTNN